MFFHLSECVKGSSDDFIDANIQLALAVVRKLQERMEARACIVRREDIFNVVTCAFFFIILQFSSYEIYTQVFPDKPEKRRASELFKAAFELVMK